MQYKQQPQQLPAINSLIPLYVLAGLSFLALIALLGMTGALLHTGSAAVTSLGGAFSGMNKTQVKFATTLFTQLHTMGASQQEALLAVIKQQEALIQGQARIIQSLQSQAHGPTPRPGPQPPTMVTRRPTARPTRVQ